MAAELHVTGSPTVVVVPSPHRGGRYQIELRPAGARLRCGHRAASAHLWLIFLEGDAEAGREVSETICSGCDPARYRRAQAWAEALA